MINNGVIIAPVTPADPYIATGTPKWNNTEYVIAINAFKELAKRTRMWAKFKPVPGGDMDENIKNSEWWKGLYGHCGISPFSVRTEAEVVNYCTGGLNGWSYDLTGLIWARLLDWVGYDHNVSETNGIGSVHISGTRVFFAPIASTSSALGFSDLAFLNEAHFGCLAVMQGSTNGNGLRHVCTNTIASGDVEVEIGDTNYEWIPGEGSQDEWRPHDPITPTIKIPDGTYDIYPFLYAGGNYYSIPYAKGGEAGGLKVVVNNTPAKPKVTPYLIDAKFGSNGYPVSATIGVTANNMTGTVSGTVYVVNGSTVIDNQWSQEMGKGDLSYSFSGTASDGHYEWEKKGVLLSRALFEGSTDCQVYVELRYGGTTYTEVAPGGFQVNL